MKPSLTKIPATPLLLAVMTLAPLPKSLPKMVNSES